MDQSATRNLHRAVFFLKFLLVITAEHTHSIGIGVTVDDFSMSPQVLFGQISFHKLATSMRKTLRPLPVIFFVPPDEYSISLLLVLVIFTFVVLPIRPAKSTLTVHLSLFPMPSIIPVVRPYIYTFTLKLVVIEFTRVLLFPAYLHPFEILFTF